MSKTYTPIKTSVYLYTEFTEDVNLLSEEQGPALTISIQSPDQESPITVDFAPVVQARLSFQSWMNWPRRDSKWPSNEKIKDIKVGLFLNFSIKVISEVLLTYLCLK